MSEYGPVYYAEKHIVSVLKAAPTYAAKLPGGIHRHVGPPNIPYPFLVIAYASGSDKQTIDASAAPIGAGMLLLLKVVDRAESQENAEKAAEWVHTQLLAANNSNISGAYVVCQRETPVSLPVVESDETYQQNGGMYRFWVDLP